MKLNQKGAFDIMLVTALVLVLAVGGAVIYRITSSDPDESARDAQPMLTEAEVRQEYDCDRGTEEYRTTDVYCSDYNQYVVDFKNATLLEHGSDKAADETAIAENIFKPISSDAFGDFGNTQNKPSPQHPDEPRALGDTVDAGTTQGVVYLTNGGGYRVLAGKLENTELGTVRLTEAFELQGLSGESPQMYLELASPRSIELDTTKIAYWANLNSTNQLSTAIDNYVEISQEP